MKSNLLVKITTLAVFAVLMSGFVAYKAGAFENYLGENRGTAADSPVKDSAMPGPTRIMAPSSKAMILTDEPLPVPSPSHEGVKINQAPNSPVYMDSSKSGALVTPQTDTGKPK